MISYKTWIYQYKTQNTPLGDLSRDIEIDHNFPKSTSRKRILEYLTKSRAIDAAIEEFNNSWQNYKRDIDLGYQMLEYGVEDNKMHILISPTKITDRLFIYYALDNFDGAYSYININDYKTKSRYEHYIDLKIDADISKEDIRFLTKNEYLDFVKYYN